MSVLWRWVTLRHFFAEPGRTALTLLGVALGVGVFVSIRLANTSALASFTGTVDAVAGKANLAVVADSDGFDERVYPRVRAVAGVEAAAPVVQTYVLARPGAATGGAVYRQGQQGAYTETLLVLGVDALAEGPFGRYRPPRAIDQGARLRAQAAAFLLDPHGIAVTQSLAGRHKLRLGSVLTVLSAGRPVTLTVRQIIESQQLQQAMAGSVIVMDIAAAQELFHSFGRLDRIDLIVDPARMTTIKQAIQRLLPPQAEVTRPEGRTQQVENMVRAFGLSLTALSFIALFVAMFLIFNTISMSALRRRREIGILRSIGVTRSQVVRLFLVEGLLLGVVGSVAGVALGVVLARLTLGVVAQTLTDLYLVLEAERVVLDPATLAVGLGLGVGMSLLSAVAPAIEASQTPPNVTVRQGILIEAQHLPVGKWTALGFVLLALAGGTAYWTLIERFPLGGFGSAFLLLAGFSLLAPGFTLVCAAALRPAARAIGGIEGAMGVRYLRDALARASIVVAALMVSVGMTVGLTLMVGSFRETVRVWVNQTLGGDLYVEPVGRRVTGSATALPPEVAEAARRLPGVAAVDTYRAIRIGYQGKIAFVVGIDFGVFGRHGHLEFVHGRSPEIIARARAADGVIVTESFSYRYRVHEGDTITLQTPSGNARLRVFGVFYDYSTDAGAVLMDQHLFARLWRDDRTERLAIYVRPGADVTQVRNQFIAALNNRLVLYVTPNQELRSRVLTVFNETFRITYALQAIAVIVALLGVITTLTALILQRGREIGVLRATGALRRQVQKMVLVESGLLGLIGSLLGCACGYALSILLIHVINKQFFGWSIRTHIEPSIFLEALTVVVATALIAGLGPARLAASRLAAEALRVE